MSFEKVVFTLFIEQGPCLTGHTHISEIYDHLFLPH